ncbi:unnamed protein product [Sphagnum troendelagicum]|uniref:Uncharacterized protein n=1 Tax=Sphagnum troendelagicum TaxID=128251 RepID=A0ABP0V3S5_9BRYO
MAVKPLSPKGLFNANLMLMLPTLTMRSDGPPSGHANLGSGLLRLEENSLKGVMAVEMIATSLRLEVVNQKAPEDVEGLAAVGETARVIAVEVRGVVVLFEDGLPEKDEGPGDVEAIGRSPFVPNSVEGFLGLLSRSAIHEAVLGGLRESLVAALVGGRDTHNLEPSADRKPFVEGQPGEGPHFAWPGVVPYSSNDLSDR